MIYTHRLALLAGISAIGLMASAAPSFAADASPTPTQTSASAGPAVEEVVVTAQKREQALSDVGVSIQAISTTQLADRNITNVAGLAEVVSSFTVAVAADGTPVYTLRGVGFNSQNLGAQPTVSVYLDEAALPYGPLTEGPIFDLERVEVLKGPQGTLFGQNSTGGAINYIAAKPTETFSAGAKVSFGRFDTFQGDAFVSGPIADKVTARLAITTTQSGDWQYSYLRNDSIGAKNILGGRFIVDWRPTERLSFSVDLNGWVDKSDNQIPQFLEPLPRVPAQALPALFTIPSPPLNDRAADWDPGQQFDRNNKLGQAIGRVDYKLNDALTLTSLTNYEYVHIDSTYEHDGTSFGFGRVTTSGHVEVFSEEGRLAGDFGRGNFLLGANYQSDNSYESSLQHFDGTSSTINVLSPPLPPPGLGSFDGNENRGKQSNTSIGVFGNGEFKVTDTLTLVGGARYTRLTHHSQECSADPGDGQFATVIDRIVGLLTGTPGTIGPGQCISLDDLPGGNLATAPFPEESFSESNVSWRGGLNYKPMPGLLVYGLVSRGYKGGDYPVINASARSQFEPVKQEQLTSYEAGVKESVSRLLQFNAAVYYYDYHDKQLLTNKVDPVFGLLNVLANIPRSTVYGFDVDATSHPIEGLTLRGAIGYAHSRIGTNPDGTPYTGFDVFTAPAVLTGRSFNFAPEWTANGDIEYRFPLTDTLKGFVGGDVTYNSATFADLAESPALRIAPYTLFGLRAGVSSPDNHWEATVFARNITNKYYYTNVQAGYDTLYRITGQPTFYGISFAYSY